APRVVDVTAPTRNKYIAIYYIKNIGGPTHRQNLHAPPQQRNSNHLIGIIEDLQTSVANLGTILGKPYFELPQLNTSNYDERVPQSLREQFYYEYPLLRRVYDFALRNYRRVGDQQEGAAQRPASELAGKAG
ncbi:MAG: hypothetical protein ACKO9H_01585, partial [Planctomycetota bacterium]